MAWLVAGLSVLLMIPVAAAAEEGSGYFHKGLGNQIPLPNWAENQTVYFLPPEGEGPIAELAEMETSIKGLTPQRLLTTRGGLIQRQPHIHLIFWGKNWEEPGPEEARDAIELFFSSLDGSKFQRVLTQYFGTPYNPENQVAPEFIGEKVIFDPQADVYFDTSIAAPASLNRPNITQKINQVQALKGWSDGFQEQFYVLVPSGTTYGLNFGQAEPGKSNGFCAFHDFSGSPYVFIAYNICNGSDPKSISGYASHEYAETVTDPIPDGTWGIPMEDVNGKTDYVEIADFCSNEPVKQIDNGAWAQPLKNNYETNVVGGTSNHCSYGVEAKPPQITIDGPTLTLGQPGTLAVEGDVDLAGYQSAKVFAEAYGSGGWSKVTQDTIISGAGKHHISLEATGSLVTSALQFRFVLQTQTERDLQEYEGRIYSRPLNGHGVWPTVLCGVATMPCPLSSRVPQGAKLEDAFGSASLTPRFEFSRESESRLVTCAQAGFEANLPAVTGSPLALQGFDVDFGTCTLKVNGVQQQGSCSVGTPGAPHGATASWSVGAQAAITVGKDGGDDFVLSVKCPEASLPMDCTYDLGQLTGTLEGGTAPKLKVLRTFKSFAEAESTKAGGTCPDRISGISASFFLDSPKPLYVAALGQFHPEAETGSASSVGMGSNSSVRVEGSIDSKGRDSFYWFQYVPDSLYQPAAADPFAAGGVVPAAPAAAGNGTHLEVGELLSGLQPGTTYRYRLVAENEEGIGAGAVRTYTTAPACQGGQCSFAIDATPNPTARAESELEDVSCAAATMCLGVGNDRYRGKGFAQLWNGSKWSSLQTFEGELKAVSCANTVWCMTVARNEDGAWRLKGYEAMPGYWEASSKVPPLPEGATSVKLKDVSCTSESACTVVGNYFANGYKPYVARWDGSKWTQQSAPSPALGEASEALLSVSCSSATSCLAVGRANNAPFAERWTGSEWVLSSIPAPSGVTSASLEGISCTSSTACLAVGYSNKSGRRSTLTERWTGSGWTIVASPNGSGEGDSMLRGISCVSANSCMAAGYFAAPYVNVGSTEERPLIQTWNGTSWSAQTVPVPEGTQFNAFNGVSCSATTACIAVGATHPDAARLTTVTLGERWR